MNTLDILKYGNLTLLSSLEDLETPNWLIGGVCGVWSAKDVMAHLADYEDWHVEVLGGFLGGEADWHMKQREEHGDRYNDVQVALRQQMSPQEVLEEYRTHHSNVMELASRIDDPTYHKNGTLPWYGDEYCLNDFLVYTNYGHKREHSAQINVFRDSLK
jgi:hypothetical protein